METGRTDFVGDVVSKDAVMRHRRTTYTHKTVKVKQSRYTPWRRLGGEKVQLLLILDLGTRWGWVVSVYAPAAFLHPGKGPPVPIVQEAGWTPEPVWTQGLQEKSFAPAGERTQIARSSSP
jgi:hypothetical protein